MAFQSLDSLFYPLQDEAYALASTSAGETKAQSFEKRKTVNSRNVDKTSYVQLKQMKWGSLIHSVDRSFRRRL